MVHIPAAMRERMCHALIETLDGLVFPADADPTASHHPQFPGSRWNRKKVEKGSERSVQLGQKRSRAIDAG
eukprot:14121105-Alexandrium_andersonii.AAC.1